MYSPCLGVGKRLHLRRLQTERLHLRFPPPRLQMRKLRLHVTIRLIFNKNSQMKPPILIKYFPISRKRAVNVASMGFIEVRTHEAEYAIAHVKHNQKIAIEAGKIQL
jgi:hypothetical protein